MITKEVRNNYKALIEEANGLLKLSGNNVMTNLDDYFMCLKDIAQKVQKGEIDPKFLVLPNDEGWFEIDANSRKINIPSRFASYGAGVQGDEVAEIIYFCIDRYFDIHDLYDKEILVQWENAAPKPDKGLSVTINKTLQILPNKVVFGWPLTEEITKYPGKVKFSVRFFDRKESTPEDPQEYLLYSFSTLTSELKINSGLDFDIDVSENIQAMIIDRNDRIYNHIRNSIDANPVWPAKMPIFELNLPATANMIKDEENDTWYAPLTANVYYDELDNGELGVGATKYTWKYLNKNGVWIDNLTDMPTYVPTEDKKPQNDTYYKKNEDGTYSIINIIPNEKFPPVDEKGNEIQLYEQMAGYHATAPGTYIVTATNIYGRGNERSKESDPCVIPVAKAATFTFENEKHKNYILEVDADGDIIETGSIKVVAHTQDEGFLNSVWVRSDVEDPEAATVFDGGEGSIGEQNGADQEMVLNVPAQENVYYFVKTTNWKNNDTIIAYSDSIRVTKPAQKILGLDYYINDLLKNNQVLDNAINWVYQPGLKLSVKVSAVGDVPHDEYKFKWVKKVFEKDVEDNYVIVWQPIDGADKAEFYPASGDAEYRCFVTTVYNKDESDEFESISFDLD